MNFNRLSEVLGVIKRLVYHEFDAYSTGLDTISISHYDDPESGEDCWSVSITIRCRKLLSHDEKDDRRYRIHELIRVVYPDLPDIVLEIESIDPATEAQSL
jgi:hypothetical protein